MILFFETILNFEFLLKSNVTNFQKYIDFNNFVNLFTEELPSSLVILLLKGNPCTENAEYKWVISKVIFGFLLMLSNKMQIVEILYYLNMACLQNVIDFCLGICFAPLCNLGRNYLQPFLHWSSLMAMR